jgi:hypothetical protein
MRIPREIRCDSPFHSFLHQLQNLAQLTENSLETTLSDTHI